MGTADHDFSPFLRIELIVMGPDTANKPAIPIDTSNGIKSEIAVTPPLGGVTIECNPQKMNQSEASHPAPASIINEAKEIVGEIERQNL